MFKPQPSLTVRRVGNGYIVNLTGGATVYPPEKIAQDLVAVADIVKTHFADAVDAA